MFTAITDALFGLPLRRRSLEWKLDKKNSKAEVDPPARACVSIPTTTSQVKEGEDGKITVADRVLPVSGTSAVAAVAAVIYLEKRLSNRASASEATLLA